MENMKQSSRWDEIVYLSRRKLFAIYCFAAALGAGLMYLFAMLAMV